MSDEKHYLFGRNHTVDHDGHTLYEISLEEFNQLTPHKQALIMCNFDEEIEKLFEPLEERTNLARDLSPNQFDKFLKENWKNIIEYSIC